MGLWIGDSYENMGFDPKYTVPLSAAEQSAIDAQSFPDNVSEKRLGVVIPFLPKSRKPQND